MKISISRRSFLGGMIAVAAVTTAPTSQMGDIANAILKPRYVLTPFPEFFDVMVHLISSEGKILSSVLAKGASNEGGVVIDIPDMIIKSTGVIAGCRVYFGDDLLCSTVLSHGNHTVVAGDTATVVAGDTARLRGVEIRID